MNAAHAPLAALLLGFAGMAMLSLAMDRHYGRATGGHDAPPWRRRALRSSGWLLIALSLASCMAAWGASVGAVAWFGCLTAGALAAAALLAYAPRSVMAAAALSCGLAIAAMLY